jgi:hypothetical protein
MEEGSEKLKKNSQKNQKVARIPIIFMGSDESHAAMSSSNVLTRTVWVDVRQTLTSKLAQMACTLI